MTLGGSQYPDREPPQHARIAGTFGAAAAAGCAAGLNAQQMRWLLDYTAQQASGIAAWQRDTDHIEKAFVFAGMPARNGVTAALLVQAGWHRRRRHLLRRRQLLPGVSRRRPIRRCSIDKLGERYEITRTNIKKWTVGSPIQAPLDAIENILQKRPVRRRRR